MVILGIDPGYAIVGWGVIGYENNHFKVLDYGAITTPAGMSFSRRLELIYDEAELLMKRYSTATQKQSSMLAKRVAF